MSPAGAEITVGHQADLSSGSPRGVRPHGDRPGDWLASAQLVPSAHIQGLSNHLLTVLIRQHDLRVGNVDKESYPSLDEGVYDELIAPPNAHIIQR